MRTPSIRLVPLPREATRPPGANASRGRSLRLLSIAAGLLVLAAAALVTRSAPGDRDSSPMTGGLGRAGQPHLSDSIREDASIGSVAAANRPAGGEGGEASPGAVESVTVPDREGMRPFAKLVAGELWGSEATLVDEQEQLGPGGRATSYLYVFTVGGPCESREEILARLAAGTDPVVWDDRVRCLEMGASEDLPPVPCYWNGLPPEYLFLRRGQEELREAFGDRPYELAKRYLAAAYPVLEYRAGSERFYYQPSRHRVGRDVELRKHEATDGEKARGRLASTRAGWRRLLAKAAH